MVTQIREMPCDVAVPRGYVNIFVDPRGGVYTRYGIPRKPFDNRGYKYVRTQRADGTRHHTGVHRLVYAAFVAELDESLVINHKNGIKDDNRVENLELVTHSDNSHHGCRVLKKNVGKTRSLSAHSRKLNEESFAAIAILREAGWSQYRIAKAFGISQPGLCQALSGKTWQWLKATPAPGPGTENEEA